MPVFTVTSPMYHVLDAENVKDAIKSYVKFYHNYNIQRMMIQDQARHYEAVIKQWKHDTRNKFGINYYPIDYYPIETRR